jgi:hypothetical protein
MSLRRDLERVGAHRDDQAEALKAAGAFLRDCARAQAGEVLELLELLDLMVKVGSRCERRGRLVDDHAIRAIAKEVYCILTEDKKPDVLGPRRLTLVTSAGGK